MAPHALLFLLSAVVVGASFRSDARPPRASSADVATDEFDADSPSWLDDAANESWPSPLVAPAVERVPSASHAAERGAFPRAAASEMYSPDTTWLPRTSGGGGGSGGEVAAAVGEEEQEAAEEGALGGDADPDEWASQMSWLPRPSVRDAPAEASDEGMQQEGEQEEDAHVAVDDHDAASAAAELAEWQANEARGDVDDEEVEALLGEVNRARMLQLTATRTRTRT